MNLPLHDSNHIAFVDDFSSRMISEDSKIVTELSEVLISSLTNGLKSFFVYSRRLAAL